MLAVELNRLEGELARLCNLARSMGLDFFDMRFEVCPPEVLHAFGAYGMPTRYSHWSFGKAYQKIKTQYDYNLLRFYEMVVNCDPCYAFLLEGNSLIQNVVVAAHVLAHSDFFKHNRAFARTSRRMLDTMASNAERIRAYEFRHGRQAVESFLDAVLSIQEQVDARWVTRLVSVPRGTGARGARVHGRGSGCRDFQPESCRPTPYDDLWNIGVEEGEPLPKPRRVPQEPEKDLLLFLLEHARGLEDWQRDIISMVREEMLYFWPQMETKIMNEGWATYWHTRLVRELDLDEAEALEFARMQAQVLQPSRVHLNPYLVGCRIFEHIEKRWDSPAEEERERLGRRGGEGREKIFEVREVDTDLSFLRNYLTKELVEELDLYLYRKVGPQWRVVEKDWEKVRDGIVASLVNCGHPYIVVEDGDYRGNGELYLKHRYEGLELDLRHLEKTLRYLHTLWGRTVHLETVTDDRVCRFSFDGSSHHRTFL